MVDFDSQHANHRTELIPDSGTGLCQNCSAGDLTVLYEARGVPTHSCALVSDVEMARLYPRGDIKLAFCGKCGFIGNICFDSKLMDYSPQYEDTQHYSGHFNEFARQLALKWVRDYDIYNKTILEIGCGKGDFLHLICTLGNNNGIGIDPAWDAGRQPDNGTHHIEFIRDKYSSQYSHLQMDVICCRHTLEHIQSTGEFIQELRQSIGERNDILLLFELPDASRILRESAFWDIYYEHCAYFTAGSLARLFRRNAFDVVDLWQAYDDQYLILAARPASRPTSPCFNLEADLEQTRANVSNFQATCPERIQFWKTCLQQFYADGQKVVAWGSGSKCVSFCTTLDIHEELSCIVDINPRKSGTFLPGTGHLIVHPEYLQQESPDIVLIMNPVYYREIQMELDRLGVKARLMTLN